MLRFSVIARIRLDGIFGNDRGAAPVWESAAAVDSSHAKTSAKIGFVWQAPSTASRTVRCANWRRPRFAWVLEEGRREHRTHVACMSGVVIVLIRLRKLHRLSLTVWYTMRTFRDPVAKPDIPDCRRQQRVCNDG